MSMIVFCVSPSWVVIAGDRYQKLENPGGLPMENSEARKVVLSANQRIAVGLCGDLPLLPGAEMISPNLWFERHLLANDYLEADTAVQEITRHLKDLTPAARCAGGNVFVGGFSGGKAMLVELRCESATGAEGRLGVREVNRITPENVAVFGSLGGHSTIEECKKAAGVDAWDGKSEPSEYCRSIIDGVAAAYLSEKKSGVSGPAESVLVAL